jgi:hypothetical protein
MSLSQRILQIWTASSYSPPKILLIFNDNQYMATIDDSGPFLRFMSSDGQIFLSLNTHCRVGNPDQKNGDAIYLCTKLDPILCSPTHGLEYSRDLFVLNNIAPLVV